MIEQKHIEHHIQKHIVGVLMYQKYARFRDLRPPKVDTNLYSYHLKLLQKNKFIEKTTEGYTLAKNGILYVDRVTVETLNIRQQPKVTTIFVVQNSDGDLLLYQRKRQPLIGQWALPNGKLHIDDISIEAAAHREIKEKLGLKNQTIEHAGDCYIRVKDHGEVAISTLAHIFRFDTDTVKNDERLKWVRPHKLKNYDLAPAVEQIVARTFFRDPYFFEEFEEEWR